MTRSSSTFPVPEAPGAYRFLMMFVRITAVVMLLACAIAHAQGPFVEQFTDATTANNWYFYDGACLTAGTNAATGNPGKIPGCTSIL